MSSALEARRGELGLNQTRAAKLADVSRTTWVRWEKGTAVPYDSNYALIERALEWESGSVRSVLAGHEPRPVRHEHSPPLCLLMNPEVLNRLEPADREAVLAVVRAAEARATRRHSKEGNEQREDPKGA